MKRWPSVTAFSNLACMAASLAERPSWASIRKAKPGDSISRRKAANRVADRRAAEPRASGPASVLMVNASSPVHAGAGAALWYEAGVP